MRTTQKHQRSCNFAEEFLIAEALGETSTDLSQQVRHHLAGCFSCRQLFGRYQQLRSHLDVLSSSQGEERGLLVARRRLDSQLKPKNRPRLQLKVWRSPVGDIRLGTTDKGVALVEFIKQEEASTSLPRWHRDFTVENTETERDIVDLLMGIGKRKATHLYKSSKLI